MGCSPLLGAEYFLFILDFIKVSLVAQCFGVCASRHFCIVQHYTTVQCVMAAFVNITSSKVPFNKNLKVPSSNNSLLYCDIFDINILLSKVSCFQMKVKKKRAPAALVLTCKVCGAPAPDHLHFGGRNINLKSVQITNASSFRQNNLKN